MGELRRTPLYDNHLNSEGKMIDFSGWHLPVQYEGLVKEHEAVREKAGLFDVSHMGEVMVTGQDAEKFVNYIITNDVTKIVEGQILYTPMCYEHGGIVDDLLVYKYNTEKYLLVINASNTDKDYKWFTDHQEGFNIQLENISDNVAQIALQGPMAEEILQPLVDTDLKEITFYHFKDQVDIKGAKALVSRTGYTGEDGFEIYLAPDVAGKVWDAIMQEGGPKGLIPAGLGARDTLRFEASLPLYGNELSQDILPLEAGLGIFVKLDKGDFIGREVLAKVKEEGVKRKTVGFELSKKGVIRHGYPIFSEDGQEIGVVTTGYHLTSSGRSIGLGLMDVAYTKIGTPIKIQVRKKMLDAQVVSRRFMDKKYKK